MSGDSFDPNYKMYEKDFNTILEGINQYKKTVNTLLPEEVSVHYFRNIVVSDDGQIDIIIKDRVGPFLSFEDYEERLLGAMARLAENAKDNNRKRKYGVVTTISKGYDAPCCAVIAKKVGCDTAVTFKANGKYSEDSGVEIARTLGYTEIIERDALDYLKRTDLVEAEYLCSGELGAQISFSAFDSVFEGNLVFTGDRGDSIWAVVNPICNNEFRFCDVLNHLGSCERRLWVGYISVPMPLYGASNWVSIQRISQSEDMSPWKLDNDYDRSIPRRICEEAGVKREMFGISKHGAGFLYRYDTYRRLKSRMAPTTFESFDDYLKKHAHYNVIECIRYFVKSRNLYLRKLGIKVRPLTTQESLKLINPTSVRYLIPWASFVLIDKYRKALGTDNEYTDTCSRN